MRQGRTAPLSGYSVGTKNFGRPGWSGGTAFSPDMTPESIVMESKIALANNNAQLMQLRMSPSTRGAAFRRNSAGEILHLVGSGCREKHYWRVWRLLRRGHRVLAGAAGGMGDGSSTLQHRALILRSSKIRRLPLYAGLALPDVHQPIKREPGGLAGGRYA